MSASAAGAPTGAVYDRGYRPYEGPRGGRTAAVGAVFRSTLRRALGFRRSWRQKFLPWSLLAVVTIPAAVNVGIAYLTRDTAVQPIEIITYREYVGVSSTLLLFVALVAPDVLCPDRRQRVLSLIFARPLSGTDYALAKLAAIGSILFAFSFLPQVVLFVGQMLVSPDGSLDYLTDNAAVLWQVPLAVTALAFYYASFGLAVASLTSRRIVAGASILGVLLVSSSVSAILGQGRDANPASEVIDLLGLPLFIRDLIFEGHITNEFRLARFDGAEALAVAVYVGVVAVALGVLVWRYRWTEA
ncbi:MAG: hypothetical protein ACRD2W_07400 [Acidimicrobiales bacterium]